MNIQPKSSAYHFRMQNEHEQTLLLSSCDDQCPVRITYTNETLGRALDPRANGAW